MHWIIELFMLILLSMLIMLLMLNYVDLCWFMLNYEYWSTYANSVDYADYINYVELW